MKLTDIIELVKSRAKGLDADLTPLLDEVKKYLTIGKYLPASVNFEEPQTIRQAQKALAVIEARLDRIVSIHHDAKRTLQILASAEHQLTGALVTHGELPKTASGPIQQRCLAAMVPELIRVKTRWQTLDQICTQAQQRLASARDSIKLQSQLDDNLRWAQHRNPS